MNTSSNIEYVIEKSNLEDNNGNIVLGNTWIDVINLDDDTAHQVSLVSKTAKGWVSKKKVVVEKAIIIGTSEYYDDENNLLLDHEQAEKLIALFNRENCKEWFKPTTMDVTTAFALAGLKYNWVYDRIDEIG